MAAASAAVMVQKSVDKVLTYRTRGAALSYAHQHGIVPTKIIATTTRPITSHITRGLFGVPIGRIRS
jgi:hypothetical protein